MAVVTVVAMLLLGVDGSPACSFDWLSTQGLPGVSSTVTTSVVWDPDGPGPQPELLIVGGGSRIAGDVNVEGGLAAWDGVSWRKFGTESLWVLAIHNGELFGAGDPTRVEGTLTTFVKRWNGADWVPLGIGFTGGGTASPRIAAITSYGGDLIAAGSFTHAEGTSANNIARWDGSQWLPLGTGITRQTSSASVDALAVYDGDLIAGGFFDTAGGIPAKAIARWDGSKWWDIGGGMGGPPTYFTVNTVIVAEGDLVAGGWFSSAGAVGASNIARWDGNEWHALGTGVGMWVEVLSTYKGDIIAGGQFASAGSVPATRIARWDGNTWHPLGDGMSPERDPEGPCCDVLCVYFSTSVYALAVYHGDLIVGGYFMFAGNKPARFIARWDGHDWNAIGSGMSIEPGALLVNEGKLITGGGFRALDGDGAARSLIATWNGTNWESLAKGIGGTIYTLVPFKDDFIVGGLIAVSDARDSWYIDRWDGSKWQPLGAGIGGIQCVWVSQLVTFKDDLYVGGSFSRAGMTNAQNIARWDGETWHTLRSGIDGAFWTMIVFEDKLIVGGHFNTAGATVAQNIAAWNGLSWEPLGGGLEGHVRALTVFDGQLIAFHSSPGYLHPERMARWDGDSWVSIGAGMDGDIYSLTAYNGELFAVGDFTMAGGVPVNSIARWDGSTWHAIPGGMASWAKALAVHEGELFVAGSAYLSDGRASANLSRWGPTSARGDFDANGDVNLIDYVKLEQCLSGPGIASGRAITATECLCVFNSDGDGDIDLADVALFQSAFAANPAAQP